MTIAGSKDGDTTSPSTNLFNTEPELQAEDQTGIIEDEYLEEPQPADAVAAEGEATNEATEVPIEEDLSVINTVETTEAPKPVASSAPKRTSVIDTAYVPKSTLIIHSEGDNWLCNYYRQLVGLDNPLESLRLGSLPSSQQYEEVIGFKLKVTSPLESTQDATTKEFTVNGTGNIPVGIIPNTGDMFTADIGDGTMGIFTITASTRMSILKDATYDVDYRLISTYGDEWKSDLESKVVRTLYFDQELVEAEVNPFISKDEWEKREVLSDLETRLHAEFLRRFWHRAVHTLRVPGKSLESIYDNFHANFAHSMGLSDPRYNIELYTTGSLEVEDLLTIWDVIHEPNLYKVTDVIKKMGLVCVNFFKCNAAFKSVAWSGFNEVIYPSEDPGIPGYVVPPSEGLIIIEEQYKDYTPNILSEAPDDISSLEGKAFYPEMEKASYVVTSSFYEGDVSNMSIFEYCLHCYVNRMDVPLTAIIMLADKIWNEPKLGQFYYLPILITLIRSKQMGY